MSSQCKNEIAHLLRMNRLSTFRIVLMVFILSALIGCRSGDSYVWGATEVRGTTNFLNYIIKGDATMTKLCGVVWVGPVASMSKIDGGSLFKVDSRSLTLPESPGIYTIGSNWSVEALSIDFDASQQLLKRLKTSPPESSEDILSVLGTSKSY